MGEPKSRKRKSKTVAEDNEANVLELPVEDVNETDESKPKTKKKKKSKALEVSVEEVNDGNNVVSESEDVKPKKKKNKKKKVLEVFTEQVNDGDDAVDESEENEPNTKKNKKKASTEELNESESKEVKSKKAKKHKLAESTEEGDNDENKHKPKKAKKKKNPPKIQHQEVPEEFITQYPVLADKALAEKFNAVTIKPHMRTRLREQIIKKFIKTPTPELPEAINSHIQSILALPEQTENDLRRVRLLVHMLKTELMAPGSFHKGKPEGGAVETVNGDDDSTRTSVPNLNLPEDVIAKYPVLSDGALYKRFRALGLRNNTKGRVRQMLKDSLKGTSETLLPDVIHSRMQAILKTDELTNSELRKLRILYNMLKNALQTEKPEEKGKKPKKEKKQKQKEKKSAENEDSDEDKEKGDGGKQKEQKVKGPKRYVVFVGNLPLDITKEKLSEHFSDLGERLKDVRVPKRAEGKKSAIAYLEVADDLSFELALSKNHSMLDNKRINVSYTTQQHSKITKTEAKGKAAKLAAMQKSGKLAGSIPLNRKRSARRNKMKAAQKKEQEVERGA